MSNYQNYCKIYNLPPCFFCQKDNYNRCNIQWFKEMLETNHYISKHWIAAVLSRPFGQSSSIYLEKAIEIFYPELLDFFNKISILI